MSTEEHEGDAPAQDPLSPEAPSEPDPAVSDDDGSESEGEQADESSDAASDDDEDEGSA